MDKLCSVGCRKPLHRSVLCWDAALHCKAQQPPPHPLSLEMRPPEGATVLLLTAMATCQGRNSLNEARLACLTDVPGTEAPQALPAEAEPRGTVGVGNTEASQSSPKAPGQDLLSALLPQHCASTELTQCHVQGPREGCRGTVSLGPME